MKVNGSGGEMGREMWSTQLSILQWELDVRFRFCQQWLAC